MDVELPDGTVIEDVPDGISRADLLSKLHKNGYNISSLVRPEKIGREAFKDIFKQELEDNPVGAKLAAFGTAASDLWHGGKQLFGMDDPQAREANNIIKEANPGSALAGNVAMYSGLGVAAPVLNTIKGATTVGAVGGAFSPTDNKNVLAGKLQNIGMGLGGSYVGAKTGNLVGSYVNNARQAQQLLKSQNATKDATQLATQGAGYVIPPSMAGGGVASRLAEGLSGKYKTNQAAQILNQRNTNALAKQYLGVDDAAAFSDDLINSLKAEQNKVYEQVANMPAVNNPFSGVAGGNQGTGTGRQVLNDLKQARFDSKLNWTHFNRTGDPEAYAKATSLGAKAEALEDELITIAQANGKPDLVDALREARRNLAKIHTIDNSMNDATGDVSAVALGKLLNNNAPLTDEALQIGKFANAYGDVARVPASGDANPFTVLDYASALLGYGVSPAALALPAARIGSRAAILSPVVQKAMANKTYGVGPTKKLAEALFASRYSPMAITGGALPALTE